MSHKRPVEPLSQRPVEVTYIERASFADMLDIGMEKLSVTDATVIAEVDMPGYFKFLRYVRKEFEGLPLDQSEAARKLLAAHATARLFERQYADLVNSELVRCNLVSSRGRSGSEKKEYLGSTSPHIDEAWSKSIGSITLNATFFTEGEWWWGLSGYTTQTTEEIAQSIPEIKVPLSEPGVVILGEHARKNIHDEPCSVVHEVISPASSWEARTVQRVRGLYFC